jgi:tetratricopeptide (TPR) repeat protein
MAAATLLALLIVAGPAHAQPGATGGTCVIAIRANGTDVRSKGGLSIGACFGPGQDIVSPPGTVVKVVTPLRDTIAISGTLRIKEQSASGQSFWVRSGTAAFNVAAKHLSFFNVEGQNGNRTFQAAVRGTTFEMAVDAGKSVTLTPQEGQIQVTRAVKLGINAAERGEGKRDLEAARSAGAGGAGDRAAQALKPNRSDLLAGSYAGKSELVEGGSAAVEYALDEDDVVSFETVEACVEYFKDQMTRAPGAEGYRNLGDCYLEGGDPASALKQYSTALRMDLQLHPDGLHPDVADDYRSLADAHSFTDPRQAITELRKAIAIDVQVYGDELDPDIAEDHRTIADLSLLLDDPNGAIAELQKALAIDEQLYPDGVDFDLAEDHRSLGEAYTLAAAAAGGRADLLDNAVTHLGRALAIDQQLYGNDADPDLAEDHRGLGFAYLLQDKRDAAFGAFNQALTMGFRVLDVAYHGDPATVEVSGLDLDSDDVDEDVVSDLYDDALTLSEIASDMGHADQAKAFEGLADRIADVLEGS